MSKPIIISIVANATQARAELNSTASTTERMGTGFRKAALPAVAALGAIGAAAKATAEAASDLNEEVSKSEQIFGKQAGEIEKFAERAEKALGQSKTAALNAASTFGIIGESAGLSGKETAEFSKKFVTLASDLASFNNTSPEEAVTAIGAAMRGEAEPIRKYGVLLDDATLRNRALKLGLIDSVKQALTPQQKALAASEEILKQTTKAQGDFARTSDGAANKSRILAAQSANLKAKLGDDLLPVYIEIQGEIAKTVDYLSEHGKETKIVAVAVAGLSVAVLAVNAAMRVATAVTTVYGATQKLLTRSTDEGTRSMGRYRAGAGLAGVALVGLGQSGAVGEGGLQKVATAAGAAALGFSVAGPFGAVAGAGAVLLGVGQKSAESAALQEKFHNIQQKINTQAAALTVTLDGQTGAITKNTKVSVAKSLADSGAYTSATKLGLSFNTVTEAALGNKTAQEQVTAATEAYIAKQVAGKKGVEEWTTALTKARTVTEPLTGSVTKFSGELGRAKTATNQTKTAIEQMSRGAELSAKDMAAAGRAGGQGFAQGLLSWKQQVSIAGATLGAAAAKAAKKALDSNSPSKVFYKIGQDTGAGFALGITASGDRPVAAMELTAKRITKAAEIDLSAATLRNGLGDLGTLGGSPGQAPSRTYMVTVNVTDTMSKAEKGREFAEAIREAENLGLVR